MRLNLKILLKKQELGIEYRKTIMHYIKYALSKAEGIDGYGEFYGEDLTNREFSFAIKLPYPKFSKDKVILAGNEIEINITTGNIKKALIFNNSFISMLYKEKDIGNDNFFKLMKVSMSSGKVVRNEEILIKMLSPIVIRNHDRENGDYYYSIAHRDFITKGKEIVEKQLERIGLNGEIDIIPVNAKKTVVKHYGQSIECSIGTFVLKGNAKTLQGLYDNGLGSRVAEGFGFFEII